MFRLMYLPEGSLVYKHSKFEGFLETETYDEMEYLLNHGEVYPFPFGYTLGKYDTAWILVDNASCYITGRAAKHLLEIVEV